MSNNKQKMGKYKALAAAVHEIFIRDWDPIGVGDHPQAQDEYDSYIPVVVKMLLEDADAYRIAKHLTQLETVSMGLSCQDSDKHNRQVAEKLVQLVT